MQPVTPSNRLIWSKAQASEAIRAWRTLLDLRCPELLPQRSVLFQQGSVPRALFLIEEGLVKLTHLCIHGDDLAMGLRFSGQVVECCSVILRNVYDMSAMTTTNTSIHRVSFDRFVDAVVRKPEGALLLHRVLARDLSQTAEELISLRTDSAQLRFERLMHQLEALGFEVSPAYRNDPGSRTPMGLSNAELANLISVTPEHLSRIKHMAKFAAFAATSHRGDSDHR
jgi:CRP-like cAMP-binding protein